jgi:hypothetical protein
LNNTLTPIVLHRAEAGAPPILSTGKLVELLSNQDTMRSS